MSMSIDQSLEGKYRIFAVFWALSTCFQQFAMGSYLSSLQGNPIGLVEALYFIPALFVLLKPSSRLALLGLAALGIIGFLTRLPNIPSHRTAATMINISILVALVPKMLSAAGPDKSNSHAGEEALFQHLRGVCVILYFFAVFHKLNTGYLNPESSCAATFYARMASWLLIAPSTTWAQYAAIYGTLLAESLIPICLCFTRTRRFGLALGVLFHSVLSVDHHQHTMDFSSVMFSLFVAFLSRADLAYFSAKFGVSASSKKLRLVLATFVTLVVLAGIYAVRAGDFMAFSALKHALWYSFALFTLLSAGELFAFAPANEEAQAPRFATSLGGKTLFATFALVGCLPYLGLHYRSSFDMYSSLRVEAFGSNHLIMPAAWDPLNNFKDLVEVLESSDATLNSFAEGKWLLTYFEFQDYLFKHPETRVHYRYKGEENIVTRAGDREEFKKAPPFLLRKLLWFRPIDSAPLARCTW